ncbi:MULTISPECIES: SF1B family DNA helicase RecD2 [unclassified Variovorax]|uniref:SF1B family DNA helicase RecD2 n=1 Tax=unclassified Variovorax TaxID=663243 RepID=UPI00076D9768|nr:MULTISPECIES: ATP-dependent RecD-like DNA helicase [unclassified Variovorax]KWT98404.1 RecD-like DNA helicase YrrC [Variovorax sp. WDL1]PNG49927.1 ATP-dependent RecD-like DNA helicase [Variovorax sp. B2]PNG50799.1 ATP-dependent RecD-like DNA helicase [Variovorax sp. B4]VTU41959.1 Exodeoxyribonuclease V alpha chain [Variovorax sp. PBL-H6]VTU44401.1 Exodeoxyribonuclease V alpha chain [Variovorax sp. SRS16]
MASPSSSQPTEQLSGVVKILTYVNPENGYFVAKVDVPGKGERTVLGTAPVINVGELISVRGAWGSSKWGPQFKAVEVTLSQPTMLEGIVKYMSNAIPGIGKGFAQKLVDAFGEDVFDVIENHPERLKGVKGIGKKRIDSLIESYAEQKATREIMVFLHKAGLSTLRAKRILDKYGASAVEKIKANPYILCQDIWGIGFRTADEAAFKQGIPRNSEYRIRAGVHYVLREAEGQGSCGLPVEVVREKASELLGVDYDVLSTCFEQEVESESLIRDFSGGVECLFSPRTYKAEKAVADLLLKHAKRPLAHTVKDIDVSILSVEMDMHITLEDAQRDAVRAALLSQVCVITGGPGTGKTTITRVVMECLQAAGMSPLQLCAPTGKAAKRAAEATGFPGQTVHRTLEVQRDGTFKFNEKNPLDADVLVVDESSMVDIYMFLSIIRALAPHTRLIIIGDVDQLPSVGPGKVLGDIIDSGVLPTVMLRQVFRQAAKSQIIRNAHAINRGDMPELSYLQDSDFHFSSIMPRDPKSETDKEKARSDIEKEILRLARDMYKLGYDPIRDVQILAPMRRGKLGVLALNVQLQAFLNPMPEKQVEFNGTKWCTGDKVMQLRNNYDKNVFNGDIGYISDVDAQTRTVMVEFDAVPVVYRFQDLDELALAYAFTIHKSQGSEFPVVIMPLDTSHYMMLRRNLVYTGVTRARKLCVVVGQPMAMKLAVERAQKDERWTRLKECLMKGLPAEMRREEALAA